MNKERRAKIDAFSIMLGTIEEQLEEILHDETLYLENHPLTERAVRKASRSSVAISNLKDALNHIQRVFHALYQAEVQ